MDALTKQFQNQLVFHKPGENDKTPGYQVTPSTERLLAEHLKLTGGQVRTRFPPEPNGILHIGHAKAININFGYAKHNNGICFLRLDDTNPEAEKEEFVKSIEEMVRWLGYEPYKVTYASDYFDKLYELAKDLIKRGSAYVCHQKPEEMRGFDPPPSPWRERPVSENLDLFEAMKRGDYKEGEACLRMKHTMEEGKRDPVAYRVKHMSHHRTLDKWCIYPTYDFAHCLCDSIENITHSLCTKEFQNKRSSYYWLCNELEVYCPVQWEYARLNVQYTVVSKRKLKQLIDAQVVSGWDDPRLYTLEAMRRRGYPSEAINEFCALQGANSADSCMEISAIHAAARAYLNIHAPRTMAVLEPIAVKIVNFEEFFPGCESHEVEVLDIPGNNDGPSHKITFAPLIFIEKNDFLNVQETPKDFRRLTLSQTVGLRYVNLNLNVKQVALGGDGQPSEITASLSKHLDKSSKPSAYIHWVADPLQCEVRTYEELFEIPNPDSHPDGLLASCRKDSLIVKNGALVDKYLKGLKPLSRFQFERNGFYCVDSDSDDTKLVFNMTVSLKADSNKDKHLKDIKGKNKKSGH